MIKFKKLVESSTYLSPFENFEPHRGEVEIRWDPLTGLTSRVVRFPTRKLMRPDLGPVVSLSAAGKCPFCSENIEAMTARLDKDLFGCERLERERRRQSSPTLSVSTNTRLSLSFRKNTT